jgi:beta-glucosidase
VIVILSSGRPLLVTWLAEQADALLAAWFLGSEAGNAVSDIVTGRRAPSGRTPITWPRALGQVPVFFAQRPSGRPFNPADPYTSRYLDVPNEPLYPFGHGLTYTHFKYANLRVTPESVSESDTIEARVELSNLGACAGEETVFLFTHDKVASVAPPLLELKGYAKATLQPGETQTVTIELRASELRFLGPDLYSTFEPGEVEILVGPRADRTQLLLASVQLR